MKKFFINVIIFIFLILILECTFRICDKKYRSNPYHNTYVQYLNDIKMCNSDRWKDCRFLVRPPSGIEYPNNEKPPILLLGCSFAYGDLLDFKDTFAAKLSDALQRTVYNRGLRGGGLATSYYQISSDNFYKEVPYCSDVIYLFIDDHYRRMLVDKTGADCSHLHLKYNRNKKHNSLVLSNYNSFLLKCFKTSYIFGKLQAVYVKYYISFSPNAGELTDFVLLYFIKMKEELEKRWSHKVNFTVILYDNVRYDAMLKHKLINNGFNVIVINDISDIYKYPHKYSFPDKHPNSEAWSLLTPLIIKQLNL